ncbi:MAG TPA: LON peptidase substrate-binding domain-containing protein [Candidatus Sulfotelmatobacter sp.]|jgi:ATP-dependent Lon protease|nr:LON peptidase substrate-binding domain-containing protein [Candidatus Sulfotelmatobacter sp.]
MRPDRISLFPLNVVLFPGELLPLHIFEPRYRRMVRECLDEKIPFGMLLALPNGLAHVGCTAEILEVTKRYDDGRMDIITVGRQPYRLLDLFTEDPLLQGSVDYLEDDECLLKQDDCEKLVELYEVCYTLLFSGMPPNFDETPRDRLSYAVAGALPLDLLWKQQILELRSEAERQDRLHRYLREWALHLHKIDTRRPGGEGIGHGLN